MQTKKTELKLKVATGELLGAGGAPASPLIDCSVGPLLLCESNWVHPTSAGSPPDVPPMFVVVCSVDYTLDQRRWHNSVQLQCYSHRRRTLHASYNTQLFSCQEVNAVQLHSVRVWVSRGKSWNTGRICGNVGWSEMERLQHINAHAGFFFFFFPSFCSVRWRQLPTPSGLKTLWFGISFKPWTCFRVCHTCYMHTSILSCCLHAFASGMWDCLCLIKATNSQNTICFRQLRSLCGNQHMYALMTHLFRLSPHLLVTMILCWRLLKIKVKLAITILQRDWQKAQHSQMEQIHRRAFMLYATISSKHASNHIFSVLMKCLLLVAFVSHQPVSCLFLFLFFLCICICIYIHISSWHLPQKDTFSRGLWIFWIFC